MRFDITTTIILIAFVYLLWFNCHGKEWKFKREKCIRGGTHDVQITDWGLWSNMMVCKKCGKRKLL